MDNNLYDFFSAFGKEPKCDIDARIMSKINHWRTKQTPSYLKFIEDDGGSDIGYLAYMFARTGVDKDAAKAYIVNLTGLSGSVDDFDNEFTNTEFDEKFRELVSK